MTTPGQSAQGEGPFTAIVCDSDGLGVAAYRAEVEHGGFEVVGESQNPVEAIHLTEIVHPDLVLTGHDYWGMSGLDLATALRALPEPPEVVLVLRDMALQDRAMEVGCYAVVPEGDRDVLGRVLGEVRHFLRTGERRKGGDRREGGDRRQGQDWSKVTHERRSGDDRRRDDRRTTPDEA